VPQFRYDQACPVARAAEIVGERWTLLIVRELLCGPKRFADLRRHLPGLSSSVLASRMEQLQERGIVARNESPPPQPASLFELTELGRALGPTLREMARWGVRLHQTGGHFEPEWALLGVEAFARRDPSPELRLVVDLLIDGAPRTVLLEGGAAGTVVTRAAGIAAEHFMALASGALGGDEALAAGAVLDGPPALLDRVVDLFDLHAPSPPADDAPSHS
jgi:DNA-binding HxlR family transcriptional regulator